MKTYRFKKIDAFATHTSSGNPAGAVYLESFEDITEAIMQQIARELGGYVSEVGFVCRDTATSFRLKYYSSEREVEFCGHATIAIMYDLIAHDKDLLSRDGITITTNKGASRVENRIHQDNAVFITAPAPLYREQDIDPALLSRALGCPTYFIDAQYPLSVINAGLQTLLVPVVDLKSILSLSPDLAVLKEFCQAHGLDIITLFSREVADREHAFRSRVFAPTFGYLEDPATGSGNAALGYYLLQQRLWQGGPILLEQNNSYERPNRVSLIAKEMDNQQFVAFGGGALVRIEGSYTLYT